MNKKYPPVIINPVSTPAKKSPKTCENPFLITDPTSCLVLECPTISMLAAWSAYPTSSATIHEIRNIMPMILREDSVAILNVLVVTALKMENTPKGRDIMKAAKNKAM